MMSRLTFPLFATATLFASGLVQADSTIELEVGPIDTSGPALGVLVADTDGNGFAQIGPWLADLALVEGGTFAGSDDVIVAIFESADSAPWPTNTGFSEVISGIDHRELGIEAGDALQLFWLPGASAATSTIAADSVVKSFRSDAAGNGADIGFVVPADGASVSITALGAALGGTFDSSSVTSGIAGPASTELTPNITSSGSLPADEVGFYRIAVPRSMYGSVELDVVGDVALRLLDSVGNELVGDTEGLVLSPGIYFVELTAVSEPSTSSFDLTVSLSNFRPDVWLQYKSSKKGRNRYSTRPSSSQTLKIKVSRTRTLKIRIYAENDATVPDSVRVDFSGRNMSRYYKLKIYDPIRRNITSSVLRGTYHTGEMAPRIGQRLLVYVKPKSKALKKRKKFDQKVYVFSDGDRVTRDAGRIRITPTRR